MAYDAGLAQRVRELLEERPGYEEKRMFGGVGFLLYGNMACGVLGEELIVRVGPEYYPSALHRKEVRPFDITGRVMKGWVMVGPGGTEEDTVLADWVERGWRFARGLPAKS